MVAFSFGLGFIGSPEPDGSNQAGGYEQSTTLFLVIGMRDSIGE